MRNFSFYYFIFPRSEYVSLKAQKKPNKQTFGSVKISTLTFTVPFQFLYLVGRIKVCYERIFVIDLNLYLPK